MALAKKGVDVRETTGHLMFRVSLKDSAGAKVTSGTTTLTLYEIQSDGTLKSYDFNDNTFKTTALTTPTASMTHRAGNNGGTNTGLWTYALTTLTGFTVGGVYVAQINNSGASPTDQEREFQFGGAESDFLAPTSAGRFSADATAINAVSTSSVTTVSAFVGSTGAAVNGTTANTLAGHDPGTTLGTSTLTQAQVSGGAYALNSSSFAFNTGLDFTSTMKTSIGTAVAASAVASVTAAVTLPANPPAGFLVAASYGTAPAWFPAHFTNGTFVSDGVFATAALANAPTGGGATAAQIADKVLGRNLAGGSDGGRTVTDALRFLRNKWTRTSNTLTVYAEDDTTQAWQSVIVVTSGADPVTSSDPG